MRQSEFRISSTKKKKKKRKKKKKKKKKKLISSPKQDKLRGNDMHVGCDCDFTGALVLSF
jgi:hypothetical protein